MPSPIARPPHGSRPRNMGLRTSAAAAGLRVGPWACLARSSPTRFERECGPTTQCAASSAPRMGDALVFPASRGDGPMGGFRSFWLRIAALAALPADITPHTLRHSFASIAADLGYSELAIAALLGHKKASVTSKYTHQADA